MNLLPSAPTKERRFKIDIKLTPAQTLIEKGMKRYTHVRAGRKFGKTFLTRKKTLDWMGPPNSVVWYILPTFKQAKLVSWADIKRIIPREALAKKPNDSDLTITLKNGSELYYMGSDEPDSLRGPAPTGVIFDEAAYHKPEAWYNVIKPNLLVHKAPALFVSTPCGFNWFKDLEDAAKNDPEWATFHYTVYDNPYLDAAEIEKDRVATDPMVWRQEYLAEYESSVGRVFNAFQDSPRHVREVRLSVASPSYRGIDWGMRDDTACVWGQVVGRKLYIYREHAENGLSASDQARIIIAKGDESVKCSIISHDAVRQDAEMKGLTVMWHFMDAGIRPIKKSSRDKSASRSKLSQLFIEDRIVIDPSCKKLRKELLGYEWKNTAMEKTADGHDNLVDALHYLVELLQYDLFLSDREIPKRTMEQIHAEIRAEKAKMQTRRFPLVQEALSAHEFDVVEGSAAGYL